MKSLLVTLFSIASLVTSAQNTMYSLDYNNVSAIVSNAGVFCNNLNVSSPGYEFPKGSGLHTMFAMGFWYGAVDVNAQLHVSGQRYTPGADIFPGPYSTTNSYSDSAYASQYGNVIWTVTSDAIQAHINEFTANGTVPNPDPSILNWPAHGDVSLGVAPDLAPFYDQNSNGNYDPTEGDYPLIKGCKAAYMIMNDNAATHSETGGLPLNIEVHAMFYQFATNDYLNNTTFVELRVINRGTISLNDFRVSAFADIDIGDSSDDYIGSDSTRSMVYGYNGQANDGDYGNNPPAFGIKALNANAVNTRYYTSSGPVTQTDPSTAAQYWNYMQGKWRFGDEHYYGGTGFAGSAGATTTPTNFSFPSNPNETNCSPAPFCWSELTTNNPPADRRGLMTVKPNDLIPGEETTIEYAFLSTQAANDYLGNVDELMTIADLVQADYDNGISICSISAASLSSLEMASINVFPNPTNDGKFTVKCDQKGETKQLVICDAMGQRVYETQTEKDEINIDLDVPKGIYFISIELEDGKAVKRIVIN